MAVYTSVPVPALEALLAQYGIGEARTLEPIAEGVENSNFRLDTTTGRYILTIYEKRVDPADLPFFLTLMDHLAKHGIACPVPIHDRHGRSLQRLCGKPAAIVSFLDGRSPKRIDAARCAALGVARLEAAAHFACDLGGVDAPHLAVAADGLGQGHDAPHQHQQEPQDRERDQSRALGRDRRLETLEQRALDRGQATERLVEGLCRLQHELAAIAALHRTRQLALQGLQTMQGLRVEPERLDEIVGCAAGEPRLVALLQAPAAGLDEPLHAAGLGRTRVVVLETACHASRDVRVTLRAMCVSRFAR